MSPLSELDLLLLADEAGWDYLPACDEAALLLDLAEERASRVGCAAADGLQDLIDEYVRAWWTRHSTARIRPTLRPSTLRRANDFVAEHHRHCGRTARNGGKFALEVADEDTDDILGVVIVGNPLSASYMDGVTAEVTRLCVRQRAPRNLCSMLYAACARVWRGMGGKRLITYTLARESGASLRGAGFRAAAQCPPSGDRWKSRGRDHQAIYDEPKVRWEQTF